MGAIEKTVRYYGEGEWPIAQRVVQQGRGYLDAFVCSEQIVIWARGKGADLVAIYPAEGALWQDHPLALLEQPGLTDVQRLTFARFSDFVRSPEAQKKVLALGYRPADLDIPLDSPGSPIRADNGVDPSQPKTSLQVPCAGRVADCAADVVVYQAARQYHARRRYVRQYAGRQD